jgi:putative transposase
MCTVFEISGYFAWRTYLVSGRSTSPPIPALLAVIRQIDHDSGQRYGRRVHAALRTQGSGACRGRTEPLKCRYGTAPSWPPRRVRTNDSRPNLPVPNPREPSPPQLQARRHQLHSNCGAWLYVAAIMASSAAK